MFHVRDGEGAHALDVNQQLARLLGRGVIAGGEVTSTAGDFAVKVKATSVYLNGQTHDLSEQRLDLAQYLHHTNDGPDRPRKVLLYVDVDGDIVVAPGEPEEPKPADQHRFDCFRPAPPDLSHTDAVPLAEIWLDPNDTRLTNADIRDRRLEADLDVHTVTADTVDVSKLIDGEGISHTGELAGSDAVQSDQDIRDAINSDPDHGTDAPHTYFSGSHDDLSDVSPEDHHPRYSDSEARDAVRGSLDAASLAGTSGVAGQHIEYTGSDVVWSDPPNQQAAPITSGTTTHTGGSPTTVLLAGVTTDETAQFELAVGVAEEPAWEGDYAYSIDLSRQWDATNGELNVELTLNWETDPGAGNDLSLNWTAFETSPVVVEGRYTDSDAIAAMDGASIAPDTVTVAERLGTPVVDDVSAITGMEVGDFVVATGDGASTFGQYIYDGAEWIGPLGTSVSTLSALNINVAKDWQGYAIENVGAPVNPTDAARQQELDNHAAQDDAHHTKTVSSDIDHGSVSNVTADQHHSRYTDAEAASATVGRVFSSTLTAAAIPSGESLQNFHHVPTGTTLTVVRAEVVDEDGNVPSGLTIQLYDRDADEVVYTQSAQVETGSLDAPLATIDGTTTISVRIRNRTGQEVAASGSMNFELS